MKKLLCQFVLALMILTLASPGWATTYYAQNSTVSINSANEFNTAANGSGTACTIGTHTVGCDSSTFPDSGSTLDANAKTAININVDPGPNGAVNLTNVSANGAFTLNAAAAPATIHTATLASGTVTLVVISGSIAQNITWYFNTMTNAATNSGEYTMQDAHTGAGAFQIQFIGTNANPLLNTITGPTGNGSSPPVVIASTIATSYATVISNANCVAQASAGCQNSSTGTPTFSFCTGSSTTLGIQGCSSASTGVINVTGGLIWGSKGAPIQGPFTMNTSTNTYTGTSAMYISTPGLSASTLYFTLVPPIADVTNGINYGRNGSTYYTGSYSAGGGGSSVGY